MLPGSPHHWPASGLCDPPSRSAGIEDDAGNCRFWGITAVTIPSGLIEDHLLTGAVTSFKELGAEEDDGWGFAAFLGGDLGAGLRGPLERRGRVPANYPHDVEYDLAVEEMVALEPSSIVGHVRNASSGHRGIPNPHPFIRDGYAFAHNGSASVSELLLLLYTDDPDYLVTHPPDYVQEYIDSELYFMWILKYAEGHPGLPFAEAIKEAVELLRPHVGNARLNCIVARGDTIWAVRSAVNDALDALRFFPVHTPAPSHWVVCSEVVGSDSLGWGTFPLHSVGMFVPRQAPEFLLLDLRGEGLPKPGERNPDPETPVYDPRYATNGEISVRPNPASGSVTIEWPSSLPSARASWEIWDATGRLLRREERAAPVASGSGGLEVTWDGRDQSGRSVPSGTYYCRIHDGSRTIDRRMTIIR